MQFVVALFAAFSLCFVSGSPLPDDGKAGEPEKTVKPAQYVLRRLDLPSTLTPEKKLAIVAELLRRRRSEVQKSAESKESMSTAAHQILRALDISKLTPDQKRILAARIGLLRRRRSAETSKSQVKEPAALSASSDLEDLDGADTYGFGAAALPFLGLYGLGLGGLGVGLGPLAFTGLFG
ncbi:Hypothetical protein NTJ_05777 [Nesidiocoris tenuis]|uniref:Corticotropin-releasing factor domain-containing protein n=1 Tax=Nesidiocoris tenuis TaxID=355587 RepID=A0ABN7AL69_9HEMI|nr:Hypothetical protein NTJ_05777 [Nesidiocoris tenuis]